MNDIDTTTLWRNTGGLVPVLGSSGRFMEREQVPVERCEHGNVYRHLLTVLENHQRVWCDGAPDLDALTKED